MRNLGEVEESFQDEVVNQVKLRASTPARNTHICAGQLFSAKVTVEDRAL